MTTCQSLVLAVDLRRGRQASLVACEPFLELGAAADQLRLAFELGLNSLALVRTDPTASVDGLARALEESGGKIGVVEGASLAPGREGEMLCADLAAEDADRRTTQWFKEEGDRIVLLGDIGGRLGGSEYLHTVHGRLAGVPAPLDLARERREQR